MPGNAGDASLSNYILEHFWLWINQIPQHQSFWNMPFYYPNQNTLAYSDVMLGGAFIYVPIRLFIKNPFTAFQVWMILLCSLNYTAFYFLLRRLKYDTLPAAIGAFIFSFGIMRYFKMNHPNYYIQYPMILSLISISYLKQHRHLAFASFFAFLSLQFWSVYTLGYFFCFITFLGFIISLFFKQTRDLTISFLKEYKREILLYGIFFTFSLYPLAWHYLMLGCTRRWDEVFYHITDASIWFRNISFLDNVVLKFYPVITEHEEICGGIGLFTTVIAFLGLWKLEKYRKPIFITLLSLMLLCVKYADVSPWYLIYRYVPGADGMRVISRIYFIFLVFYCLGIAEFFKNINKKSLIILCLLLLLIEQLPTSNHTYLWSKNYYYDYVTKSAYYLPKECNVLYYDNIKNDGVMDVLVMWIANFSRTYSANGSSGVLSEKKWQDNAGYCSLDIKY